MSPTDVENGTSTKSSLLSRFVSELGVYSVLSSPRDVKLLYLSRFTRLFAYGGSTLVLALYLASLGNSDVRIGLFMTLTLLGDVVISFLLTLVADGVGRRNILIMGSALMTASGVVFALSRNYWVLVAASVGNEIGPFRAVEESTLAQLTPSSIRSDIFAWHMLLGNGGAALGTVVCGWLVQAIMTSGGKSDIDAYRVVFGLYAGFGLLKLVLSAMLSEACESEPPKPKYQPVPVEMNSRPDEEIEELLSDSDDEGEADAGTTVKPVQPQSPLTESTEKRHKSIWPQISRESRKTLVRLCLLFAVDSFASGLVPNSWIIYFFNKRYDIKSGDLGTLFFVTNLVSMVSHLFASSMAKRIGLIKTMVFTHLPSSIFLALIPAPQVAWLAMVFLILRSSLSQMDQAPRQAFLSMAVLPTERTAVMGVVNIVKTLSQSGGPVVTGNMAAIGKFWIAFALAGGLKAAYDAGILKMFLGFKTQEEEEAQRRKREQMTERGAQQA